MKYKFRCACSQKLRVANDCGGKWVVCPHCEEVIQIPSLKVAAAASAGEKKSAGGASYTDPSVDTSSRVLFDTTSKVIPTMLATDSSTS